MTTLLIVDDESSIRYAMEKGLRTEGLRILTSETAQAGIEAVNHYRPDVVVCDIRLPDLSGLDAFQKMREIDPHLPVIIITAHADRRRIGKFEQADSGTLFLDEIGDMSLGAQAQVLRILQDGRFERVGGNETLHCDVRIIAATNNNLEQSIVQKDLSGGSVLPTEHIQYKPAASPRTA